MGDLTGQKNRTVFTIIALCLGILVGLIIAEVFVRILPSTSNPRLEFGYNNKLAHCYPSDPYKTIRLDLFKNTDRAEFVQQFPTLKQTDPLLRDHPDLHLLNYGVESSSPEAMDYLVTNNPHCVIYNLEMNSTRRLSGSGESSIKIGIIGDSFAFGQGVEAQDTLGFQLAKELKSKVYNYSNLGANNVEIFNQFNNMLPRLKAGGINTVVYIFVFNDPFMSKELQDKQNFIFDYMNIRKYKMDKWSVFNNIKLIQFLSGVYRMHAVTSETTDWYHALFNPQRNPGILSTFDAISKIQNSIEGQNKQFHLVVYPLMDDFDDYKFEKIHRAIRILTDHYKIKAHDLLPAFKNSGLKLPIVHPLDYHPNAKAHSVAANSIASYLKTHVSNK